MEAGLPGSFGKSVRQVVEMGPEKDTDFVLTLPLKMRENFARGKQWKKSFVIWQFVQVWFVLIILSFSKIMNDINSTYLYHRFYNFQLMEDGQIPGQNGKFVRLLVEMEAEPELDFAIILRQILEEKSVTAREFNRKNVAFHPVRVCDFLLILF